MQPNNNAFINLQTQNNTEQPPPNPEELHSPRPEIAQKVDKENHLKPSHKSLTTKHQDFLTKLFEKKDQSLPLLGPFLYNDGSTYYGNYKNGQRHGFGMLIKQNGEYIYTGFWQNDQPKGMALVIDELKNVFQLLDHGASITSNGLILIVNGKAIIHNSSGETFGGEFIDGKLTGKANYSNSVTKEKYQGEFVSGVKHGKGEQSILNNFKYVGEFFQGKKQGNGVIKYANGSVYKGEFWGDMKHGKGAILTVKNVKYEGDFLNDEKHGKGIITMPNGLKYEGDMEMGKMEGQGVLFFPNGKVYKGGFKDGKMHGQGMIKEGNEDFVNGIWDMGNKIA